MKIVGLSCAGKRYRRAGPWVLRDVSVSADAGTVIDVRGVNGSGKSTLLALLAGATVPTYGRRLAPPRLPVGYTPERLAPPPPFSASAFLAHHARMRGQEHADGQRRITALAERLDAGALLSERLGALSKGSLQKIVLIQALLAEPPLLVLDEPFSGLDADAARALAQLLRERAGAGAAVLLTDHRSARERVLADATWLVAGGGVEDATEPGMPERLPGVVDTYRQSGGVTLRVAADASDDVLASLLARGWHVVSVTVTDGGDSLIATGPREHA